jgi:transglutaminase-like putative cysteine protease
MNTFTLLKKAVTRFAGSGAVRRWAALVLLFLLVFVAGYSLGSRQPSPRSFHDMIVNHPADLTSFIAPGDKRIVALAAELKTPENAFAHVRDRIAFDPSLPVVGAGDILSEGRGSCLGKAVLLCALYRALGMKASSVRVVTGEVDAMGGVIDHAWVELEYNGRCLQQDTTDLLGKFTFDQFRGMAYTNAFIKREGYVFNDRSFAIVSRLNMMKGSNHPMMTTPSP